MSTPSGKDLRAQYDLPHWGALCYRVRASRGLTAEDIGKVVGASRGSISSTLEQRGNIGFETFKRYIEALRDERFFIPAISEGEARMLQVLYETRDKPTQRRLQLDLANISFKKIASHNKPAELKHLVDQLRATSQPAFIGDNLRFVHAVNGELLTLYNIDPHSDFLHHWEAWHDLAIKFQANSPVRQAHPYTDQFLSDSVTNFLQDEVVHRYLFTVQMRTLISSLIDLSREHAFPFYRPWYQATSFLSPNVGQTARTIEYKGERIQTKIRMQERLLVPVIPEHSVHYSLIVWEPDSKEAYEAFADITQRAHRQQRDQVYFAADYDRNNNFHINTWPEVAATIESSG